MEILILTEILACSMLKTLLIHNLGILNQDLSISPELHHCLYLPLFSYSLFDLPLLFSFELHSFFPVKEQK